jgi:hypothetical protein
MNTKAQQPKVPTEPTEDDIRDYAYHLYVQSGCLPGHDLENWLEATACLKANIPSHQSRTRLHRHVQGPESGELCAVSPETKNLAS